jgi:hypothetical protein
MADETPNASAGRGGRFDDWEQVAEVGAAWEAELIRGRLMAAGFEAEIVDQSFELVPLINNTDFERMLVVVPTARAEEARRVLAEPAALPDDMDVGQEPEVPVPGDDEPTQE